MHPRFAPPARFREAGLTGEAVLVLIIGFAVVVFFGCIAIDEIVSTEDAARAYAEQSYHRLLFAHDAAYLANNIGLRARAEFPPYNQRYLITSLTKLGVPKAPPKIEGEVIDDSESGTHDPVGRYDAYAIYPATTARFHLQVRQSQGRWRIDYLSANWQNKEAGSSAGAP